MAAWDDLDLQRVGDDRFVTQISGDWSLMVPQGGVVAAIGVRAMQLLLGDATQTLRTTTAMFAGQVSSGPVEADVTMIRRGRTMSQLAATVRNPGADAGLTMLAAFGTPRRGFTFTDIAPPSVRPPDELRSFRDPLPDGIEFEWAREPFPFWERVLQSRPALGRPPWEPWHDGPAEAAYWYRFDDPPVGSDGALDVAGVVVMLDTMPGAIGQKVPPQDTLWFSPSVDYTLHVLGPASPGWMLAHMRARHAGDGYASIEASLWDLTAEPRLVAYATQLALFTFGR